MKANLDIFSNRNIDWNGNTNIKIQGAPWEDYLQSILPEGTVNLNAHKPNFKTFDHLLPDSTAISAKTMDTVNSTSYQNPSRITAQLNKYVNQMDDFKGDGKEKFQLKNENISKKQLYLAIPAQTSKEQMQAIQKSIEYGRAKGIEIIVTKVK